MADGVISGLLHLISSAVTPVVMISAAAALIIGINQKHVALSDRLRTLAAAFRSSETTEDRRENIRAQVLLFRRRFFWITCAHYWLYLSVLCFIGTVVSIVLTERRPDWEWLALTFFMTGSVIMLAAVAAELVEIHWSRRTVYLEIEDVVSYSPTSTSSVGPTG